MDLTVEDFQSGGKTREISRGFMETKAAFDHIVLVTAFFAASGQEPPVMSLADKIPSMSDEQVNNLLANARRLSETGDERQQAAAGEILGILEETAAQRKADRLAAAQVKRAAARPKKVAA
jgi:hypothetical protein